MNYSKPYIPLNSIGKLFPPHFQDIRLTSSFNCLKTAPNVLGSIWKSEECRLYSPEWTWSRPTEPTFIGAPKARHHENTKERQFDMPTIRHLNNYTIQACKIYSYEYCEALPNILRQSPF